MEKELKITKENILKAASKCSAAKETLKTLFPECFEEENKYIPFVDHPDGNFKPDVFNGEISSDIQIGMGGVNKKFRGRCLVLSEHYNWEIIDNLRGGFFPKLLVCTKKK